MNYVKSENGDVSFLVETKDNEYSAQVEHPWPAKLNTCVA